MDDRIYDLLNDVKVDFGEYEEKELSSKEKQKIKMRLLQEVKKVKRPKENRGLKTVRKIAGIAAAACLIVFVIAAGSNPAAAKNMLSDFYEKVIAGSAGEKDSEDIRELYTKIGEESVEPEPAAQGNILEAKDAGITLRVCDVFCDAYKLYYTLELEADNENLTKEGIDGIITGQGMGTQGQECVISVDGEENAYFFAFQKQEDGTYTSVEDYSFFATEDMKTFQDGDVIPVEVEIKAFAGVDYDNHDEEGEYVQTDFVEGQWKLSFPVTVDTAANIVTEINKEDNGVRLISATKTKATINLVIEAPDFTKEPYNDPYNDPDIGIMDAEGNWMQMLGAYDRIKEDGSHMYQITLLDNGSENFTLNVTEKKNEEAKNIAAIEFQIPR